MRCCRTNESLSLSGAGVGSIVSTGARLFFAAALVLLAGCAYGSESYNQETWRLTIGSPLVIELVRDASGSPDADKQSVAGTRITLGRRAGDTTVSATHRRVPTETRPMIPPDNTGDVP